MGAKSLYLDTVCNLIAAFNVNNDIEALKSFDRAREEYKNFASSWKKANLDNVINKLSKKLKMENETYNMEYNKKKISFYDDNNVYEIVCSIGARYFRIRKIDHSGGKGVYVDLNLKEPIIDNKKFKGKAAKMERQRLTHFKMTFGKGDE